MRMTDVIEEFIKELFNDEKELVEIQRNELAEYFNCVPSQINYVISTRFKPSQGYYVESRRGGRRAYNNKESK
ncbi:MAG: CtsR family transcriptional regulator [Clostridia bacterium]